MIMLLLSMVLLMVYFMLQEPNTDDPELDGYLNYLLYKAERRQKDER